MAKADRLERIDIRRDELETHYRETLVAALRKTASGIWGLFDHRQNRSEQAAVAPTLDTLNDLADTVNIMRSQLGMAPFPLHEDFQLARGPVKSSAVGEPKQAKAWLERLEAEPPESR